MQSEMESKLIQATAEQDDDLKVHIRTAQEQYSQETTCLKEEFLEERKK